MTWVVVFDTANVRGSVYEPGEHDVSPDHAAIIVATGLGEEIAMPDEEEQAGPAGNHHEGNGAEDRDAIDIATLAAEAAAAPVEAETPEAPAEADEAAETAEEASDEAPAIEDGAAPA